MAISIPVAPTFAVVGHPNKGKSSIVATLAQDDSVYIDRVSGSTTRARHYPMRVDGKVLYDLVDTPGFQRARSVLAWLNKHCQNVSQRPAAVLNFYKQHRDNADYCNEVELLAPIIDGGGIIYVVDGSRPYGPEYNAEMEILRWTGQPSLALINPIDGDDYVADWETALGQYFSTVRVFNAHRAEFAKRIGLLSVFGQLHPDWQQPLQQAVDILKQERKRQHRQAGELIANLLIDVLQYKEQQYLPNAEYPDAVKTALTTKFANGLRQLEQRCRKRVEEIYHYYQLQTQERELEFEQQDLLDRESWFLFGLSKKQLVTAGAGAGASAGVLVDLGTGGHSLLLGSLIGGALGGVGAWQFSDRLAKFTVKGLPTGGLTLTYGPVSHPNFPFVVFGRALRHHDLICTRTHAVRETLAIDEANPLAELSQRDKARLMKTFADIRKGRKVMQNQSALTELVLERLFQVDGALG